MRVIEYQESFCMKERKRLFKWLLTMLGICIFFIIFVLIIYSVKPTFFIHALVLAGAVIVAPSIKEALTIILREYRKKRKGEGGEKRVKNILRNGLNEDYTYISNFKLPGKKFDIDGILVGPKGLFIFEIKAWDGRFRAEGQKIVNISKDGRPKPYKDVIRQVLGQVDGLEEYLRGKGFTTKVTPMVVFTLGKVEDYEGKTSVWITDESRLLKDIFKNKGKLELSHVFCQHLVDTLIKEEDRI